MTDLILLDNKIELAKQIFNEIDTSANTRKDYQYRIGLFFEFLKDHPINVNTYLEYKRFLSERDDYKASTKMKYLATAKVFLNELHRRGIIPIDITKNIKGFRQNKKHTAEGFSQSEVDKIVEYLNNIEETERVIRLKAIFCLLTLQGLRQVEVVRLDIKDINLNQRIAFVKGKGADDKELIHLHPETIKALKKHIKVNRIGSGALFKGFSNRSKGAITTRTVKYEFEEILNELDIDKTVHGFRHYYITTLLQKFDVRDVRKFSRHKSLEMLIVYDDEIDVKHKSEEVFSCFKNINIST